MNEQSPLLNTDIPLGESMELVTSAAVNPQRVPASPIDNRWSKVQLWLSFVSALALLIAVLWVKLDSDLRIQNLELQLVDARSRLDALESDSQAKFFVVEDTINSLQQKELSLISYTSQLNATVAQQNRSQSMQLQMISTQLATHDQAIVRLSNGTSNADVLDKLKMTKEDIDRQLAITQSNVSSLLQENAQRLETTQQEVSKSLNTTMASVRVAVGDATRHIHEVQRNVTGQLNGMSEYLANTVKELSGAVRHISSW